MLTRSLPPSLTSGRSQPRHSHEPEVGASNKLKSGKDRSGARVRIRCPTSPPSPYLYPCHCCGPPLSEMKVTTSNFELVRSDKAAQLLY